MKFIYQIIEEDVDGCGTPTAEYVESSRRLNQAETLILKQCLDEAKSEAEDSDTWSMVQDAVEKFKEKAGRELRPTDSPFADVITF